MRGKEYTVWEDKDAVNCYNVFLHFRQKSRSDMVLLESLSTAREANRYSIVGLTPRWKIISMPDNAPTEGCVIDCQSGHERDCNWLDELNKYVCLDAGSAEPQLGLLGYIGYEKRHAFEKGLLNNKTDTSNIPDLCLVYYSLMYWYDHWNNCGCWVHDDSIAPADRDTMRKAVFERKASSPEHPNAFKDFYLKGDVRSDFTPDEHRERVNATISYIRQGDVFQANITERFSGDYTGDPIHLYHRLRDRTANPFFAFLDFEYPIISTSPERFFKIEDRAITTMPIKGTIAGAEGKHEEMQHALMSSAKDRAENCMIVDLMRNDLSKVCIKGSITVDALCRVVSANNVLHLESQVSGRLDKNQQLSDILRALFPAGSVTGAPKIRAMDIIEELEKNQRKSYCGCIGFFGSSYVDTAVAIRVIQCSHDTIYLHAGGGIVVDSHPEQEYNELQAKIDIIRNTLISFDILQHYRRQIDALDRQILGLLADRFNIIREVAGFKKQHEITVVQPERVREVIERRTEYAQTLGIPAELIHAFYTDMVDRSMDIEHCAQDGSRKK